MISPKATVRYFHGKTALDGYTTAVSLHAHTNRSRETMRDLPRYFNRIPIVARRLQRELRDYEQRNREPLDFARAFWRPPLFPEAVLQSEWSQIADSLGLKPVVSITDHDNIDASLELQRSHSLTRVPISFEWTVPYHRGFFHLGVHNLPTAGSARVFADLSAYTRAPEPAELRELLTALNRYPEILVVLNHPLWDLAGVGPAEHVALLRRFVNDHGERLHAVEVNGYRSRRENDGAAALAEQSGLPLISGGDRHGCAPNSVLNLTRAPSFGAFTREVREDRRSVVLLMPQYRGTLIARKLAVAADTVRRYPSHPAGQQRWTDRMTYESEGVTQSLSEHWAEDGGGPFWVRSVVRAFQLVTSRPLLPLAYRLASLARDSRSDHLSPATLMERGGAPLRRGASGGPAGR
jgi:hypothetical protein